MTAFDKKDYKTALTYLLRAFEERDTDPVLSNLISQSYLNINDYANAEKFLKKMYLLDSMNYLINYNLGYFYYSAEENYRSLKKAIHYFEKELETYPYDTMTLQYLGTIYLEQKDLKKVKEICDRLLKININSYFGNKGMGYLAELDSNFIKALSYYKKSLIVVPDDAESNNRAAVMILKTSLQKNWTDALRYSERAVNIELENAYFNYIYSKVLLYIGDYSKGAKFYYKAIEINPLDIKDAQAEELLKLKGY